MRHPSGTLAGAGSGHSQRRYRWCFAINDRNRIPTRVCHIRSVTVGNEVFSLAVDEQFAICLTVACLSFANKFVKHNFLSRLRGNSKIYREIVIK